MFLVLICLFSFLNLEAKRLSFNQLRRCEKYPLYEQVEKHELSEDEKHYYTRKRQGLSVKQKNKYKFTSEKRNNPKTNREEKYVILQDEDETVLWSMKEKNEYRQSRTFIISLKGITAICNYDKTNSLVWVDKQGNIINRLKLQKYQAAYPTTIKDSEIWLIQTEFDHFNIEAPRELPNLASLIFCDSYGNILNKIELKYANLYNEMTLSESNDYFIYVCYKVLDMGNYRTSEFQSYLFKYDGSIIKEYPDDIALVSGGYFSEKEDVYVDKGSTSRIIDLPTGEFITSFKTHGRSAVANKETGIVAILDFGDFRVINYKTKELLFHYKFEIYPRPKYLEISGDGKEVIVLTKDHRYKYRKKE